MKRKRAFRFGKKSADYESSDSEGTQDKRAFKFGKRSETGDKLELDKKAFKFGKKWIDGNDRDEKRMLDTDQRDVHDDGNFVDGDDEKRAFKFGKKSSAFDDSIESVKKPSFRFGKKIWSTAAKTKRMFKFGKKSVFFPDPIHFEEVGKRAFKFGKKSIKGPPGRFLYEISQGFDNTEEMQPEEHTSYTMDEPVTGLEDETVQELGEDLFDLHNETAEQSNNEHVKQNDLSNQDGNNE